jgi:aryl-alcohol dehydrogenase-like predicted oxidoreductase
MNYKTLGNSALHISEISFGCMSLTTATDKEGLIHQAMDKGINFFDTADLYDRGENETLLGQALKGRRQQAIIATKAGNQWKADGSGWEWNPRKDYILTAVEDSLRRLNTDYIDLYQLHGGTLEDPIDETIEAFELLQQQGKIRYYGISSIRPNVIREYVKRSHIISVMMQYSLLDRRPEESCLSLLKENNIGVLARGGVAKGLLGGKPAGAYLNYSAEEVAKAASAIKQLSANRTEAQTALQFVLSHPAITSAVVGIRTLPQLEEAAGVPEALPLTAAEIKILSEAIPANLYDQHR